MSLVETYSVSRSFKSGESRLSSTKSGGREEEGRLWQLEPSSPPPSLSPVGAIPANRSPNFAAS